MYVISGSGVIFLKKKKKKKKEKKTMPKTLHFFPSKPPQCTNQIEDEGCVWVKLLYINLLNQENQKKEHGILCGGRFGIQALVGNCHC